MPWSMSNHRPGHSLERKNKVYWKEKFRINEYMSYFHTSYSVFQKNMAIVSVVSVVPPSLLDNAPNYLVPGWVRYPKGNTHISGVKIQTYRVFLKSRKKEKSGKNGLKISWEPFTIRSITNNPNLNLLLILLLSGIWIQ